MSERIFVGNGKEKQLKYGPIIDIVIDVDSILREYEEHGFMTEQGKRKIKLKVGGRKDVDQYGNTHFVEVDTWKPNQGQQQSVNYESHDQSKPAEENNSQSAGSPYSSYNAGESFKDDIPF